jgi:hypothetical protein
MLTSNRAASTGWHWRIDEDGWGGNEGMAGIDAPAIILGDPTYLRGRPREAGARLFARHPQPAGERLIAPVRDSLAIVRPPAWVTPFAQRSALAIT